MKRTVLSFVVLSGLFLGCSKAPSSTPAAGSSASPVAATPQPVVMEDVGVRYTLPADWKKLPDGNLSADNGNISVFFIKPPEGKGADVLQNLLGSLQKNLTDVKVKSQASEHVVGGIPSVTANGTGKTKEGKEVEWGVEILLAKRTLILLEIAAQGSYQKNQASFDAFEQSFSALAPATPGSQTP